MQHSSVTREGAASPLLRYVNPLADGRRDSEQSIIAARFCRGTRGVQHDPRYPLVHRQAGEHPLSHEGQRVHDAQIRIVGLLVPHPFYSFGTTGCFTHDGQFAVIARLPEAGQNPSCHLAVPLGIALRFPRGCAAERVNRGGNNEAEASPSAEGRERGGGPARFGPKHRVNPGNEVDGRGQHRRVRSSRAGCCAAPYSANLTAALRSLNPAITLHSPSPTTTGQITAPPRNLIMTEHPARKPARNLRQHGGHGSRRAKTQPTHPTQPRPVFRSEPPHTARDGVRSLGTQAGYERPRINEHRAGRLAHAIGGTCFDALVPVVLLKLRSTHS